MAKVTVNFFLFVGFIILRNVHSQLSEKQLKASTKLVRNTCQSKLKVTNAQIDAYHNGDFVQDPALMCFMECCLRMGKLIKDKKYDYESALKQLPTVPVVRQAAAKVSILNCKDSATSDDKCVAAFEIYKCLYTDNPDNFILP